MTYRSTNSIALGLTLLTALLFLISAAPVPTSHPATQRSDSEYETHVAALRARLPERFTIVVQKPFVVIGDESPDVVRRRSRETVGWAVERLKRAYFSRDPERILNVWLFKDAESYETHAQEMFGEKSGTPYGYYSSRDGALVMNISTGGGTLVHEIVHPFMEANFADCPAWFNEGLGSLYEQSADRDGEIVGLPNWRLRGLQKAIRDDRCLSFKALTSLSTANFYGDESGRNYAEARYLCQYLQEKKLLRTFYAQFVEHAADDPTGYAALKHVLGGDDISIHEQAFKRFVMGLRFP